MPNLPKVDYEDVAIDTLIPADYNPRTISKEAMEGLKASLETFGLVQAIVVNRRTGNIIGGHQRVAAMKEMGIDTARVAWIDVDDAEEKALNLTLNNREIEGEFIPERVKDILEELSETMPEALDLFRLREMGVDLGVLAEIAGGGGGGTTDEDDIPEIAEGVPPLTKLGDMIVMEENVLLCGDSLLSKDVDKLMSGKPAQMIFTDPPWNVFYGTHSGTEGRSILNDSQSDEDWLKWIENACKQLGRIADPGAHIYLVMATSSWPETHLSLEKAGFKWSTTIAWVKDQFVMSASDYHQRWEAIWYGWKKGVARRCPLEDRTQDNAWEFDRPRASPLHPHTKPVALVEKAIRNSSKKGDLVVDLFGGSGSTLIAATNAERQCRLMELDPHYCDVITQRWVDYTGREAYLVDKDGNRTAWTELVSSQSSAPFDSDLAEGVVEEED